MKVEFDKTCNLTRVENMNVRDLKRNSDLDELIQSVDFRNQELYLTFDNGESSSGMGFCSACHLPVGDWLHYGISEEEEIRTKTDVTWIREEIKDPTKISGRSFARNRHLLFYRWMDPRDAPLVEKLKKFKEIVDEVNPGKDFFSNKFFGVFSPLERYRKLKHSFGHEDLAKYYEEYRKKIGELTISACYNGDVTHPGPCLKT